MTEKCYKCRNDSVLAVIVPDTLCWRWVRCACLSWCPGWSSRRLKTGCEFSSTAFNFGIICMTDFSTSPLSTGNFSADIHDELPLKDRRFSYSTVERSSLFAGNSSFFRHDFSSKIVQAVFAGAFVSLFPLSAAMTKFGIHRVLTVLGLMAALVTMSTPYVAVIGFPAFCILRFIQVKSIM